MVHDALCLDCLGSAHFNSDNVRHLHCVNGRILCHCFPHEIAASSHHPRTDESCRAGGGWGELAQLVDSNGMLRRVQSSNNYHR